MKRFFILSILLFTPFLLLAQTQAPQVQGQITATSSACATAFSCVWESVLPINASTTTITVSGTFTATLLVEKSNSGYTGVFTSVATLSAPGLTTYSVNGLTDIRVRCSAYTSGTAVVTISTGVQTYAGSIFPDVHMIAAANCNNATAGTGWSLPSGSPAVAACRTGTNIQDGVLQFVDGVTAQFSIMVPADWDTAVAPSARLYGTQAADGTASHTIIMQMATSCSTTTDDAAFNAAQPFSTATSTATANTPFAVTLSNFTMTGCGAGMLMHVQIGRAADSNVSANVYQVVVTFPRLLTVQAN